MARPKSSKTKTPRALADILAATGVEKRAFTISEFCARHCISLGTYARLRETGHGPRETRIGRRVTISDIAETAWMEAMAQAGQIDLPALPNKTAA